MEDNYMTIAGASEGYYSERRSRFISFAFPVQTPEEAKERIDALGKRYHDARHLCWAFMLGAGRTQFRVSDDGEPSSTAGKPILGAINTHNLTNILVAVVRYFGGVKLGPSGLITAYRAAAIDAIEKAEIVLRTVDEEFTVTLEYSSLDTVMKIVKEENPRILSRVLEAECRFRIGIRRSRAQELKDRLLRVRTVKIFP
ncbi:MAG: YigZ family protein [Dysgonamonadaceae bacterium]|jgi:uncharacterized YigZ family protein|nr:YigZ family protein [Dysgonamonadaceae bacterium]